MDNTPTITISTHNVNGYKRSKEFLLSQCKDNENSIRAIQEHWLRPPYKKQFGVNQLRCLHPNFDGFGSSAMKKDVESKITTGRPYGGTGFIYHKKISSCVKPLINHSHERVSVMEVTTTSGPVIMFSCYFPYFNQRDIDNYSALYSDTVGFIDSVMHTHREAKFIVLADFNCNIHDVTHRYTQLLLPLMAKYSLESAYTCDSNFDYQNSYTRYDSKTSSYTLIDGILLSKDLKPYVKRISITHCGNNVSDHIPVEMDLSLPIVESSTKKPKLQQYVNWSKLTPELKNAFKERMKDCLANIQIPTHTLFHGNTCCSDNTHKFALEQYYLQIVSAVSEAESILPKVNPNVEKSFWNNDLSELKRASMECNTQWKDHGCPKSGPLFECHKKCHYSYKAAIRKYKAESEKEMNNNLHDNLTNKNGLEFWRAWNSLNKVGNTAASRINGETDDKKIANEFADYFESVYSGSDSPIHTALKEEFSNSYHSYYTGHIQDDISPFYVTWPDMVNIATNIKAGKASAGIIKPEHFLCGSPDLLRHLQMLFNGMLQHSFVPTEFLRGSISPIVKDSQGDVSQPSNYRGITLSSLPAKLFEYVIQIKTGHLLETDELQFGFKGRTSTSHAIYTLQTTINYFNTKGSKVYVAFLDCSKAFDRISHQGLFLKLIDRKFPLCILMCLVYWYANMTCVVKWGSEKSRTFEIPLGIKQGGINSPDYFSLYCDGLIKLLRKKKIGCNLFMIFLAIIMFADDMCLLAPTRSALESIMSDTAEYCNSIGLAFNPKKSRILVFSKRKIDLGSLKPVFLNNCVVEYVTSIKYLGVTIVSSNGLKFSASGDIRSFYRAANSILTALNKPSEEVLMQLLYTNCVPILTYACESKVFSAADMRDSNTAINNAIRKIFSFNRWESVRFLRENLEKKSIYEIFHNAKSKFQRSLALHRNSIIRCLGSNTE